MSLSKKFKNYSEVASILHNYSLQSFKDINKVNEYAEKFGLKDLFETTKYEKENQQKARLWKTVSVSETVPFEPDYHDLCRIHWLVLSRKVINIMEFGSGYSTAVMANAVKLLDSFFGVWVKENVRVENAFHIYSIEEEQRFVESTQNHLGNALSSFATITRSAVELVLIDNRVASLYSCLPNICPDFIYIDGPSQFATNQAINGFCIADRSRMPMSADVLRFEFFLEPGTLILVDGRTANARFLKAYLRRNWAYLYDPEGDVHYFELQESPLGSINQKKLNFCLEGKWMLEYPEKNL